MIIGSHNSWSYAAPRHWWQRLFAFTARCQAVGVRIQYMRYGVRCFDLRLKFDTWGNPVVVHNLMEYAVSPGKLRNDLNYLNAKGDCQVRMLLDIRSSKRLTDYQKHHFRVFCQYCETSFPNIRFWGGRSLYDWQVVHEFPHNPSCADMYSSVQSPRVIDDWFPWLYARLHNRENLARGTDCDILLIDFVNIT